MTPSVTETTFCCCTSSVNKKSYSVFLTLLVAFLSILRPCVNRKGSPINIMKILTGLAFSKKKNNKTSTKCTKTILFKQLRHKRNITHRGKLLLVNNFFRISKVLIQTCSNLMNTTAPSIRQYNYFFTCQHFFKPKYNASQYNFVV